MSFAVRRSVPLSKIRVLHIITRLDRSGAPLAVWNVLRRLPADRYSLLLAAGPPDDPGQDIVREVVESGIRVQSVPALQRRVDPLRDAAALWQLMRIIGKGRFDLVHCHTSKAGFLGRIAARLCGVPAVVYTPHGTVLEGYFGRCRTWIYASLEGLVAPLADRIVSLTPREVGQYLGAGIGVPGQHTFIYNGVDVEAVRGAGAGREAVRSELGIPGDAFLILSVGRLTPVKGHVHMIEAMPEILAGCPRAALVVVGEGPSRGDLEARAAALGVTGRLRLPGHREDVPALLGSADLFVMPSLNEGLGLALLEAMSAGLAAVASRTGGLPDVLVEGETGLLTPPGDAGALAEAVVRLSADGALRARMGAAGLERVRREFSLDRAVRQTEQLYRQLMEVA